MVKIKICGITNMEDAVKAVGLGVDIIGFNFFKRSPRYINPEAASDIAQKLPCFVYTVGVFANDEPGYIKKVIKLTGIQAVQFHGNETPAFCDSFNFPIIKAFRIKNKNSFKDIDKYHVDAYLLDTYETRKFGGTGKIFNWDLIKNLKKSSVPIFISGGLNPDNVLQAIKVTNPYAVDVNSGIEKYPGKKDYKLMCDFVYKVRKFD
jgi:phosphoribosylanthranilate isomerase